MPWSRFIANSTSSEDGQTDHPDDEPDRLNNRMFQFDPGRDKWTECGPMKYSKYRFSTAVVNSEIYVLGGIGCLGADRGQARRCLDNVEIYNPDGDFWREGPEMLLPLLSLRTNATSAGVVEGKLYVCGGYHGAGFYFGVVVKRWSWPCLQTGNDLAWVAIKSIRKDRITDELDRVHIQREIEIMSSLRHPNIIRINEVFESKDKILIVMENASRGELYDYVNDRHRISEPEARSFFRQLTSAVHYCHKNGVVHRDLKLENILLDQDYNIKLADFGLSTQFKKEQVLQTYCGSPLYASPEIVNGLPYRGPEN